ncbi:PRC-barrel domain-containing protein [Leisingera sp. JC1]|uniref:PRC-barrel domain-containing protein n=1 Tax=Leisingera sp. JC1 TaxID=1855282 RepID=UPI0008030D65|nr:PRC-barrel domain-containing protein [Leisingera sp. JC1]OBY26235.1 hypothetical protein A9D60_19480 [Leisingera sp. JC1]
MKKLLLSTALAAVTTFPAFASDTTVEEAAEATAEQGAELASDAANAAEQAGETIAEETSEAAAETEAAAEAAAEEVTEEAAEAEAAVEAEAEASAAAESGSAETMSDTGTTAAMQPRVPVERDGYMTAEETDLTAEKLTGAAAYDANDEWIGEVSELLLTDEGKVKSAVIDVGGFLGLGEKPVELDLSKIDILRADDGSDLRVYIPMTEEELKAMPDYEG